MTHSLSSLPVDAHWLILQLRTLSDRIRDAIVGERGRRSLADLSRVSDEEGIGDIIYEIDRVAEEILVEFVERDLGPHCPGLLIAEGVSGAEGYAFGDREQVRSGRGIRLIVDPIDGTRVLMTDKRSAWVLCGAAPDRGPETSLADIAVAVQTEIPTMKQWRADQLWAVRGGGMQAAWRDIRTGQTGALAFARPEARDLHHAFVSFARFFPGVRDIIAEIEDEILRRVEGPPREGSATIFEDQYISTGGQLYEMIAGHDRLAADLRPLMAQALLRRGLPRALACHPYDLAAVLIAQEADIHVTDARGGELAYPLDTDTECTWIGYGGSVLRERIEPVFQAVLRERGLI